MRRLFDRLPEGTLAIGAGRVVNGVTAYAFITVSSRDLGVESYSPVAMLWALSFLLGVGFFLPLEQETARLVASRRSRGEGSGPVIRSAALLGSVMALALAVAAAAAAPLAQNRTWAVQTAHDAVFARQVQWFPFAAKLSASQTKAEEDCFVLVLSQWLLVTH